MIVIRPQPGLATPFDVRGLKVQFGIARIAAAIAIGFPDFARAHATLPSGANRTSTTRVPARLRPLWRPEGLSGSTRSTWSRISLSSRQITASACFWFPQLQQGAEAVCARPIMATKNAVYPSRRNVTPFVAMAAVRGRLLPFPTRESSGSASRICRRLVAVLSARAPS